MNIALVDDDDSMLAYMKEMLSIQLGLPGQPHTIDTYGSSEEFLGNWHAGKYDLIILDIYMDGQNGIEAAEKIREKDSDVRLAFCTSSNDFAAETYDVDARDYLQKPVTPEKIARLLKKVDLEQIERTRCVKLPDGTPVACRSIICAEYSRYSTCAPEKSTAYTPHSHRWKSCCRRSDSSTRPPRESCLISTRLSGSGTTPSL